MKRLLLLFIVFFLLAYSAFAQIIPIRDIQYTTDPAGTSPLKGQVVTISGIVTEEHRGANAANGGLSTSYFYMADSAKAWGGLQIYYKNDIVAEGDSITVTGTVDEYGGQTELTNITSFERHATLRPLPGPIDVTTAEAASEAYEGCLVRVNNVSIVEINIGTYKNWKVDDGSGAIMVDTRAYYYFNPVLNESLKSLTGIVFPSSGVYVIAPRLAWDVVEGGPYTRIQRIQQVRNSDLVRTPVDTYADYSYAVGDTVTVKGVVTMPTGLSYAGAGIKFIFCEAGGGPWSGILSYHPDSTAYPTLFEGDLIEMTGYIGEYRTTASNMTEFWITSPINILDVGQPVPPPNYVKTGDLRVPTTAEQWGTCMVYVKDAPIVNLNPAFELYAVDDGSGSVLVDDDSDSLVQYYASHPKPSLGTIADSIRGWVYHHYGSYADSSTYKLEPLYISDIKWGAGPPSVSNVTREVTVPTSNDNVEIEAVVATNLTIAEVKVYYEVISNGSSTGYASAAMTNSGISNIYEGIIPKQASGSFVNYFVKATDTIGQSSTAPADTSLLNFCYVVKDGPLTIADVQYTPWKLADSPFEGYKVAVTGVVTIDTSNYNKYLAWSIQDAAAPWSGIFAWRKNKIALNAGDEVTVYGTVTDYNVDYHYKWDNNTMILTDSVKIISTGKSVDPIKVTTGELASGSATAEPYEGVLVEINSATFVGANQYDVSFNDGSGICLVDGDFMLARDQDPNTTFYVNQAGNFLIAFGDTIRPGDVVNRIRGVFTYSFGTAKIEVRNSSDFGTPVGVNLNFNTQQLSYRLDQNYPNPFNPETRIYFEIPESQQVKMIIYNILGQKVRTLINEDFSSGYHIVNWDGRDDSGKMVPSGVYIYRIKAGNFVASHKMLMMK